MTQSHRPFLWRLHTLAFGNQWNHFKIISLKNALLSLGHAELLASTLDKCARCESLQIPDIVLQWVVLEVSVQVLRQGFAPPTGCDSLGWGDQKLKVKKSKPSLFPLAPPQGASDFNSQKWSSAKDVANRCAWWMQHPGSFSKTQKN